MTIGQVFFVIVVASLPMSTPAYAMECVVEGPRYRLTSDTVNWSIKIGSNQSCIRGVRFGNVAIETLEIVSPPQIGQVKLQGPSFTYSAKLKYQGEDAFTIAVSGSINRSKGSSTIRVIVAVGNPAATTIPHDRAPGPIVEPKRQDVSPIGNDLPPPGNGSLPPCPTWDWSSGSPPPMRAPFDRSKLYCPPPPFKPPSRPIGCICE
jgi:hypothetical protein